MTITTIITFFIVMYIAVGVNLFRWLGIHLGSLIWTILIGTILLIMTTTVDLDENAKYVELHPHKIDYYSFDGNNYVMYNFHSVDYPYLEWLKQDLSAEKAKKVYRLDQYNYFNMKISDDNKPLIVRK